MFYSHLNIILPREKPLKFIVSNCVHICRKDGGTLRQMNAEKLLKTLPQLQNQLDALVDFEVRFYFTLLTH